MLAIMALVRCSAIIPRPSIATLSVRILSQTLTGRAFALPTLCYHSVIWNNQITIVNALIRKRKNTVIGKLD